MIDEAAPVMKNISSLLQLPGLKGGLCVSNPTKFQTCFFQNIFKALFLDTTQDFIEKGENFITGSVCIVCLVISMRIRTDGYLV